MIVLHQVFKYITHKSTRGLKVYNTQMYTLLHKIWTFCI